MLFRVDDWRDLPGPLFFARAVRLVLYKGVMRHRYKSLVEAGEATTPAAPASTTRRPAEVPEGVWLAQHSDWIDSN